MDDHHHPLDSHFTVEDMARFNMGRAEPDELVRLLLPHVLGHCPQCARQYVHLETLRRAAAAPDPLTGLTDWPAAAALWDRLQPLPFAAQLRAVARDATWQTWGLCRYLQLQSAIAARTDPAAAGRLAALALGISDALFATHDPDWVRDLRALTLAQLGRARGLLGESWSAEDAFATAGLERESGTGDPAVEAETLLLEALLRRDQHRLRESADLLQAAHACYLDAARPTAPSGLAAPVDPEGHRPRILCAVHLACCRYRNGEDGLSQLPDAESLAPRPAADPPAAPKPPAVDPLVEQRRQESYRRIYLAALDDSFAVRAEAAARRRHTRTPPHTAGASGRPGEPGAPAGQPAAEEELDVQGERRVMEVWRRYGLAQTAEAAASLRQAADVAAGRGDAAAHAAFARLLAAPELALPEDRPRPPRDPQRSATEEDPDHAT